MVSRRSAGLLLSIVVLMLSVACSDNDIAGEPTAAAPTSDETPAFQAENEQGKAPVFRRTTDNFASLRSDEPYKVVFRITNGYEAETLSIVARPDGSDEEVAFEAAKVDPGDLEPPGAYYAVNLDLPEPGAWQITVLAGEDQVIILVEVAPAEG